MLLFNVMRLDAKMAKRGHIIVNFACQLDWINKCLRYLSSAHEICTGPTQIPNSQHKGDL